MGKIVWSSKATFQVKRIRENIRDAYSAQRALKYIDGLLDMTDRLEKYPEFYPPCRIEKLKSANCRCFVYKKQYRVVYRVLKNQDVRILAVMGASQNPKDFEKLV